MIPIGKYSELSILRETSVGLYLGDDFGEDILLPNKYCPEKFDIGNKIRVFVYLDYEGRKVATNLTPKILLNEFAMLQVKAVSDVGAFMDWGMEKDLLVPFKEQQQPMEEGRSYLVYLAIHHKTSRLFASNRIEKQLSEEEPNVEAGQQVDLLVYHETELGFSVIVNNEYQGLVFKNEVFKPLQIGERLTGYVKKVREDNKIDISIHPIGYTNFNDVNASLVHQKLVDNNGFLPLSDKSEAEKIYSTFGISKKAFKKAIGALYKQKKILIKEEGITLAKKK